MSRQWSSCGRGEGVSVGAQRPESRRRNVGAVTIRLKGISEKKRQGGEGGRRETTDHMVSRAVEDAEDTDQETNRGVEELVGAMVNVAALCALWFASWPTRAPLAGKPLDVASRDRPTFETMQVDAHDEGQGRDDTNEKLRRVCNATETGRQR